MQTQLPPTAQINKGDKEMLLKEQVFQQARTLSAPVSKRRGLSESTICLLAVAASLVFLDVAARFTNPMIRGNVYKSANRSYAWWATKSYLEQKTPNIVLMGSSLVRTANLAGDATHYNHPVYSFKHHRSDYLQELLAARTKRPESVFCYAIGGQMASDAYAIVSTVLKGDKAPKTLIYGIAPRDFMDNCLLSPSSTETYKYMERIGSELDDEGYRTRPSFWEQLDYTFGKVSFIYGHKADLLYLQNQLTRQILAGVLHTKNLDQANTPVKLRVVAVSSVPEDFAEDEIGIKSAHEALEPYSDNTAEYLSRYRKFNKKLFAQQTGFLKKLVGTCAARNIKIVLVNMPVTQSNMNIMPSGFYKTYLDTIGSITQQSGVKFIDLNDASKFPASDFSDTVHLNGFGGEHFFQLLADKLVQVEPNI